MEIVWIYYNGFSGAIANLDFTIFFQCMTSLLPIKDDSASFVHFAQWQQPARQINK
jgi:hypothetical protein